MSILITTGIVLALTALAAVCSGLNVSLLSINFDDLKRKRKLGDPSAKKVYYFRKNTHLTLAAILLTNVAAVSATSLVLESVLFGLLAGIITTLLMVIFGEILPQAWFSRRSLWYFARFAPLVRLMIIVTYPVSKPLQLLLDHLFKKPRAHLYSRQELGFIVSEHLRHKHSELDNDEVEIIRGALQLSEKRVADIMLPIKSVFWLTPDTVLSPETIRKIKKVGRSRIPIFDHSLSKCSGILLMKDLVDIDFAHHSYQIKDLTLHRTRVVGSRTALDTLLRKFFSSSHLIPVEKNHKIVGIVTIEDLIEEIFGHEIEDEIDQRQSVGSS